MPKLIATVEGGSSVTRYRWMKYVATTVAIKSSHTNVNASCRRTLQDSLPLVGRGVELSPSHFMPMRTSTDILTRERLLKLAKALTDTKDSLAMLMHEPSTAHKTPASFQDNFEPHAIGNVSSFRQSSARQCGT